LVHPNGAIYIDTKQTGTSIERLRFLAKTFSHCAWLNPVPFHQWEYSRTTELIRQIFPMFELTLDGLEKAVQHLTSKGR
jgi:hypothetical protein